MTVFMKTLQETVAPAVGYEEETGYYIMEGDRAVIAGLAETAARILQANGIRHFDYRSSLTNNTERFEEFINTAAAIGFEV